MLEFTLEIDHLDVMFVEEDLQLILIRIHTCVLINNETGLYKISVFSFIKKNRFIFICLRTYGKLNFYIYKYSLILNYNYTLQLIFGNQI